MRSSPLASAVGIGSHRNASHERIAKRMQPQLAAGMARLPSGSQVFHGLPFDLGPGGTAPRWILLETGTTIDLTGHGLG